LKLSTTRGVCASCSARTGLRHLARSGQPARASLQCGHFEIWIDIMTNLSIRGLDDQALAALEQRAAEEGGSVNTLVMRLIEQGLGLRRAKPTLTRHDDADAMARSGCQNDATEFELAITAFSTVDAKHWK
jgi:plasmid stability protein